MKFASRATPYGFKKYANGANIGKEMDMWLVQQSYSKVGQIMSGMGFEDSPDCEFLAGGETTKDVDGMAMGRCGNIFHWGFSASPAYMTESAKIVFVNTVFYMAKFNGEKSLVKRHRSISRKWVDEICYKKTHKLIDHKTGKFSTTGDNEKDDLVKYYTENYNYFYFIGRNSTPVLDEEAKSLGIANNDVHLLEKCVGMLLEGKDTDKALTLLKRYTEEEFTTVKEWKKWLKKNKKKLFFTELGGYKFMVDCRK